MRILLLNFALLVSCLAGVTSPAEAAPPACFGARATIVGSPGDEVIVGTPRRDVIVGLGGDDVIRGRRGDDLLCGGLGSDKLHGGPGADRIHGGLDRLATSDEDVLERTGDVLRGGAGDDRMIGGRDTRAADEVFWDEISWDTAPAGVDLDLDKGFATGHGHDSFLTPATVFTGSPFADEIDGSAFRDRIRGGRGGDTIRGWDGSDVIYADVSGVRGGGDDTVLGGEGADVVESLGGDDHLVGGPGDDQLYDLGKSADVLRGGDGDDIVADQLTTEAGSRLVGGAGRDEVILFGNQVNPTASAATGSMEMATGTVQFDAGTPATFPAQLFEKVSLNTYGFVWTITGTSSADEVGASGSDGTTFDALGGDDRFMGSASDDTFDGGEGTDRNLGMGVGANTCVSVEVDDDGTCAG